MKITIVNHTSSEVKYIMNELIPVTKNTISETETLTCDARALHAFMEVRRDFSNWIKQRIDKYGFVEGQNYIKIVNNSKLTKTGELSPNGLTAPIDYTLSIDMAKQLAMVENNEKGMDVRRYFIKCEQIAKEAVNGKIPKARRSSEEITARAHAVTLRQMARLGVYPEEMKACFLAEAASTLSGNPVTKYLPPVKDNRGSWLSPTELGAKLRIFPNTIGRLLKSIGMHGEQDSEHKHSQPLWNKSQYSSREVVSYVYNPDVVLPVLDKMILPPVGALAE